MKGFNLVKDLILSPINYANTVLRKEDSFNISPLGFIYFLNMPSDKNDVLLLCLKCILREFKKYDIIFFVLININLLLKKNFLSTFAL